jgi:hypothetical protein
MSEKDKAKQKVKSIELMFFSFRRMWYTANSTDSESVDLIMKSIIFFFKFTVYYFFSDLPIPLMINWFGGRKAKCEAELLKN